MPPNILYLNSHDTGRYVQPYGHAIPTPNIQWLADQGVMFRNAFCAAPSCSGSRAALLTGSYCHNNGMMGLAHRGFALNDPSQHIAHTLHEAGYHTEMIGEQHVSVTPDALGYDLVRDIENTTVSSVAPAAIDALSGDIPEPFFLSVGFFETHRSFFPPSSVRDRVYSLPPPFLPDTPEIRQDVAAYKASARSLDHGVGAVLNTLHETGLDRNTLVICTTDHGLAFPTAKASLLDRGIGVMLIIRGPGMPAGVARDELVSHLDIFPTICEVAGIDEPPWLQGCSLLPLVSGTEPPGARSEIFAELTYHAAYEPQRAIRTERFKYVRRFDDYPYPVLANCDESPSKDAYLARGWATRPVARERLHDLFFNPGEGRNSIDDPDYAEVAADLRARLEGWMAQTNDPLLDGPVLPPPGARINAQDQLSASDPTLTVESQPSR
ncbi:MAG TPA: sulfatase [Solirubrobacteraceae bacterium]|jgi:N-sulfoglucosamine sulfohydrolase|nr:sulfatase [Solirubrobacteraceae bacterium]